MANITTQHALASYTHHSSLLGLGKSSSDPLLRYSIEVYRFPRKIPDKVLSLQQFVAYGTVENSKMET